jgi:hypothetical protein
MAAAVDCDVQVDSRSLYTVTLDGRPYKNKRYVSYDDALMLRDVLVATGACRLADPVHRCEVREEGAGGFKVIRGGSVFVGFSSHASYEAAYAEARKLAEKHLCVLK